MNKQENLKAAKEIFANHSSKDVIHFASDGSAFFLQNDLKNHVATLTDKETHSVNRSDVKVSAPSEESGEGDKTKTEKPASTGGAAPAKTKAANKPAAESTKTKTVAKPLEEKPADDSKPAEGNDTKA